MTKAEAGSLGGLATVRKYGVLYMSTIGRRGARTLHERWSLVPYGMDDFMLVNRQTGDINAKTLSGKEVVPPQAQA